MTDVADTDSDLLRRIKEGDERALVELFARHRDRLKRMVRIRLDRRLQGRVDPSDIIQEAHIEVLRRAVDYIREPSIPAFLWFRLLAGERLLHAHRRHMGTQMRDAGLEISLQQGPFPQATSVSLAVRSDALKVNATPCRVDLVSGFATGASLTGRTVSVTLAGAESTEPSLAR